MLVPDKGTIITRGLGANQMVIGPPDVDPVDARPAVRRGTAQGALIGVARVPRRGRARRGTRGLRQRVHEADTRHKNRRAKIRHYAGAVGDLVSRVAAGGKLKADIVLAERAGVAGERVGVAA